VIPLVLEEVNELFAVVQLRSLHQEMLVQCVVVLLQGRVSLLLLEVSLVQLA